MESGRYGYLRNLPIMPHVYRGTKGTIGEFATDQKSGALTAAQMLTTIRQPRVAGNILISTPMASG